MSAIVTQPAAPARADSAAEVPPRYKRTEAGVIPIDWDVSSVGSEFTIQLGKMLDAAKNTGVPKPYIGNRAVQWGRIDIDDLSTVAMTPSDLPRFRLKWGDFLVCEGGEIGRAALWNEPIAECYYQKALHRLRPTRGYDAFLMMCLLELWTSSGHLANYVTRTSIAHLPKDKFELVPLPVPPPSEQRAIAAALSDVAELIAALDKLIAKKRVIKQAAMQQLLTGKTRLPGFERNAGHKDTEVGVIPEDWDVRTCEELCTKIQDGTHFSPRLGGNDRLYVTSRNIGYGVLDVTNAERIDEAQHRQIYARCDVKKGDLLLTKDGANTGNAALNHLDEECSLLSSVAFLRFDLARHDAGYYLQYILSAAGQKRIKELMSGNAITRLTLEKIRRFSFPSPRLSEQRAIASVLSDIDAEIIALERRREKTKAIKQGMMQALLTGRVRLVKPGAKA